LGFKGFQSERWFIKSENPKRCLGQTEVKTALGTKNASSWVDIGTVVKKRKTQTRTGYERKCMSDQRQVIQITYLQIGVFQVGISYISMQTVALCQISSILKTIKKLMHPTHQVIRAGIETGFEIDIGIG